MKSKAKIYPVPKNRRRDRNNNSFWKPQRKNKIKKNPWCRVYGWGETDQSGVEIWDTEPVFLGEEIKKREKSFC